MIVSRDGAPRTNVQFVFVLLFLLLLTLSIFLLLFFILLVMVLTPYAHRSRNDSIVVLIDVRGHIISHKRSDFNPILVLLIITVLK